MIKIIDLGTRGYQATWQAMRDFTDQRTTETVDEVWLVEHPPVFTLGQAGKREHILTTTGDIPIIESDRGGQITYHGPGQVVLYVLIDLRRYQLNIRQLVCLLETAIVQLLAQYAIKAYGKPKAPGVYVDEKKIASIGLRIRNHSTYHGIALNTDMDLTPFASINPCGYPHLQITQIRDLAPTVDSHQVKQTLSQLVYKSLNKVRV